MSDEPTVRETSLPSHVAVGECKGCGHRIQALRVRVLGSDCTPNVNPETCIYCPPPRIEDTCCGKCPGDTCYVDQITGA